MVDDIRQVTCRKRGGCPGAQVLLLDRDHLDRDPGLGLEAGGHGLLPGETLRLILGGPELQGLGLNPGECDQSQGSGQHPML